MNTQNSLVLTESRPNAVIRNGGPQLLRGLVLPMPPSKNQWMRAVNKGPLAGRLLLTRAARAYKIAIAELALVKRFRFGTQKPLRMAVLVCPPDKRHRDCHNFIGQLCDALQDANVFEDDAQLESVQVDLGPVMTGGRVIISLWEIVPDKQSLLTQALRGEHG